MKNKMQLSAWLVTSGILLAFSVFFRFAVRGYSYIAHTLVFITALIVLHRFLPHNLWRIVVALVCVGLIYFTAVETIIIKNSGTDDDCGKKYLVVLGAAVNGEAPSRSLLYRLNGTLEFMNTYPQSVAIVSGGQGDGEDITEAECMYLWLTERGIAPERIIKEPRATSTMENLQYSYEIIRSMGDDPAGNVTIASSSYHLCRAKMMSENMGVTASGYACATGNPMLTANFFIREAFGVTHLWVFGN